MFRRILTGLLLFITPLLAIPIALVPVNEATASPPLSIQHCLNGGWQAPGQPFKDQGQCIAFAVHHPVSLADLASSSVSGTLMPGLGPTGCTNADMTVGAAFSGNSAIGAVTLQMPGCLLFDVPNFPFAIGFSGTFQITTNVGTLSGTVVGGFTNVLVSRFDVEPVTAAFTLTATSGTGLFGGTTGVLNLNLGWSPPGSEPFFGTISAA